MLLHHRRRDFVPRDSREAHEWIFAAIRIQVAAAQPDHAHAKQDMPRLLLWLRHMLYNRFAGLPDDQCFHRMIQCAP